MALTPLDIQHKSFTKQMRGFAPQEVDQFLDQIVADYSDVLRKNRDYEKSIKHLEEKLRYFNELKEALNQSIIVAQETADQVKDSAQKEAEVIVADANTESSELLARTKKEAADMIADAKEKSEKLIKDATDRANYLINDATAKANSLAAETADLKKKARSFHQRMTLLLESQLEVTKSTEWDELLKPFSSYVTDEHQNFKNAVDLDKIEKDPSEALEAPEKTTGNIPTPETTSDENGAFLGQTVALDRKQLDATMSRSARHSQSDVESTEKEESNELPKLERRKK